MSWKNLKTASSWIVIFGLGAVFLVITSQSHVGQKTTTPAAAWTVYDPDPNHIWNRLYRTFYRRESRDHHEYGYDELDPLLWVTTKYLLTNPASHQALSVLKTLRSFRKPWLLDPETRQPLPNPDLPEFPAGTQLALVRRMVLIDAQGELRPTNIIEDVQIRVHRTIPTVVPNELNCNRNEARAALDVMSSS